MRPTSIGLALAALLNVAAQQALANEPAPPTKPKPTAAKVQAPRVQAPKASVPKGHAAKIQMPKVQAPKVKVTKTPVSKTAKSSTSGSKTTIAKPTKTKTAGSMGSRATTLPPISGTWTPTNAVAQKLATKPNMIPRARGVLPPGTDLNLATAGFKNYGQFVATVNNAQNHGLDFAQLKALMTGIRLDGSRTGQPTLSLGQAKQRLLTTGSTTPTARRR